MSEEHHRASNDGQHHTTRRDAIGIAGGGIALGMLGLLGPGNTVVAQQATPEVEDSLVGSFAVVRVRRMKPGYSAVELARTVGEGFVPIVREVPGFIGYFVVADDERGTWASINIFEDRAGADESTERAADFGQQGTTNWVEGDPIIIEGLIETGAP